MGRVGCCNQGWLGVDCPNPNQAKKENMFNVSKHMQIYSGEPVSFWVGHSSGSLSFGKKASFKGRISALTGSSRFFDFKSKSLLSAQEIGFGGVPDFKPPPEKTGYKVLVS